MIKTASYHRQALEDNRKLLDDCLEELCRYAQSYAPGMIVFSKESWEKLIKEAEPAEDWQQLLASYSMSIEYGDTVIVRY